MALSSALAHELRNEYRTVLRGREHEAYQQTITADIMKREDEREAAAADLEMAVLHEMT